MTCLGEVVCRTDGALSPPPAASPAGLLTRPSSAPLVSPYLVLSGGHCWLYTALHSLVAAGCQGLI